MKGGDFPIVIFHEVIYFTFFSKMIKYNFFFLAYHLDLLMGTILALCELTCLHTKSLYTQRVEVS